MSRVAGPFIWAMNFFFFFFFFFLGSDDVFGVHLILQLDIGHVTQARQDGFIAFAIQGYEKQQQKKRCRVYRAR